MDTLTAAPETCEQHDVCRVASAARSTFDINELLKRCMDDRLLAARLVDRFVTRLTNALYELQCSLDAEDWNTAASQAHRLKGEAGNLAACDVFSASSLLEECLVRGCLGDASGHFQALRLSAEECERKRWTTIQELSQPA